MINKRVSKKIISEIKDFKESIELKIKKTEAKINARVDDLEKVVNKHSEEIKQLKGGLE